MSPVLSAVLLAAVVVTHSAAHAQSSMLRVTCEGADIGAEVSVNGTFKGECPLDIRVSAGTTKLRVAKKGSGMSERVFEQDIRLGDGVEKTIVASLSGNRLPAEGTQDVAPALVPSQPDLLSRLQGIWCWDSGGVSGKTTFAGNSVQVRAGLGIFSGSNHGTVAVLNDRQFRISLTNREDIVTFVDSDNIRWDKDGTVARRCDQSLVAGANRQIVEIQKTRNTEEAATTVQRPATERSGQEHKPLAAKSAASKGRRGASDTAAKGLTPPRPAIPLEISEDIWKIIEASEAYRKLPPPRALKVVFQGRKELEYTGSKSRSLPKPGVDAIRNTRVSAAVGDKCSMTQTDFATEGKPEARMSYRAYQCGYIHLGSSFDGKPSGVISCIDELSGSLFPMRVGARQTISYQMANLADRQYDSKLAADCTVVSRLAAQKLDARLAGAAWKIRCKSSYSSSNSNIGERETDDYYLEDLAVMLSSIGEYDSSKDAHVLPSAGTQTLMAAEGDYGSRTTTTYANYDWEVGGVYEMPAPIVPPTIAAAPNEGRRAAPERYELAQREQPRLAGSTDAGAQAEQSASGGSDLFGAILGGLASGLVDHAAAQINSAAAGTGGADGVAMGVLGSITAQLARETKDQVARDGGGNGQAATSQDPAGSSLVNSLAGAMINQTNNVTASALAGDGHTGMAALVGNMNSAMLSSLQGSGSTGSGSSGAAASPKASAGSARIFVVSRSTREEACEVSKRMTKQDGQEITGTCSCNTLFNSNNCRAEVVGPKGVAATPQQLAAAKECATPSKQKVYGYRSTGNAQFDAGCSLVAFDVCLAKTTGLSTYTQEANIQCSILRRTMKVAGGGSVCELPCAAAAKLPVADPCQYLKNCTK